MQVIRNATPLDIDIIIQLCEEHAHFEKAIYDATNKKEQLSKLLFNDAPKLFCLIAEIDAEIIGYATYSLEISTWDAMEFVHMDCLYLKEKARNNNIGEQLIKQIKENTNHKPMQWQTPHWNEKAIKFYQRIGAVGKEKIRFYL